MEAEVKRIEIFIDVNFKGMQINMRLSKKGFNYSVRQYINRHGATKSDWEDVIGAAGEYILEDFKQTDLHNQHILEVRKFLGEV